MEPHIYFVSYVLAQYSRYIMPKVPKYYCNGTNTLNLESFFLHIAGYIYIVLISNDKCMKNSNGVVA